MLVYVAHPYGGLEENKKKVEEIVKELLKLHPFDTDEEVHYISPIHAFGYLYEEVDYEKGLRMCLDVLDKADALLLCGDYVSSKGCIAELTYAQVKNKPIYVLENYLDLSDHEYYSVGDNGNINCDKAYRRLKEYRYGD